MPSFKKLSALKSNNLGANAGSENGDVAEYSPFSYLYLYAKHIYLSSKNLSCDAGISTNSIVGAYSGGLFMTSSLSSNKVGSPS